MNVFHVIKMIFKFLKNKEMRCNFKANLINMTKNKTKDNDYLLEDRIIDNVIYEIEEDLQIKKTLKVLTLNETLNVLEKNPKSYVRFNDGEISFMQGNSISFQQYDEKLANRLIEILESQREDFYIGLNWAYWHSPLNYIERNKKFYRENSAQYRKFFLSHCNIEKIYLGSGLTNGWFRYHNVSEEKIAAEYERVKNLFNGKKIAVVSGEGVLEKLDFDVFEKASEKIIIHGLRINAFSEYDNLLKRCLEKIPKNFIVCIVLGPTAKVLAWDLDKNGYIAWDVGHTPKDYDAYMHHYNRTEENINKFWAPD